MLRKISVLRKIWFLVFLFTFCGATLIYADSGDPCSTKEERRKYEEQRLAEQFKWWPTDAKPGHVKDQERGG